MEQLRRIRGQYALKISKDDLKRAEEIVMQDDYSPVLKNNEFHPEAEYSHTSINTIFDEINIDSLVIDESILNSANNFRSLLESTKLKLDNIKTVLRTEKERQEDINILCNKYTDFSDVIIVNTDNSENNLSTTNNTMHLNTTMIKPIKCKISDVSGNGYEGNKYVLKGDEFVNSISNTSIRDYLVDNSNITFYEYSRVTADNSEKEVFPDVNFDSIHAKCSILLYADDMFNTLTLSTETDDIVLESISTSIDGQSFKELSTHNVPISDKKSRFNTEDYVYGSGIISFDDCKFVKLSLRATKNTSDNIGFVKKNVDGTNALVSLKSGKRSVIKINNIELGQRRFSNVGKLTFNDFVTDPVKSIAIFANEYMADGYEHRGNISYTLTINGDDFDVVPVNSNSNGKKIIRMTNRAIPAQYVHYINEEIKSATLTVDVKTPKNHVSPYLSDLKILIGGE